MKYIIISLIICATLSCSDNNSETNHETQQSSAEVTFKPLIILNEEESGWGSDIRLSVESIIQTENTTDYKALSTYKGTEIGLLISLPRKKSGNGFGKGLTLKSIGLPSDHLIKVLSSLYNQKIDGELHFIEAITVPYADLHSIGNDGKAFKSKNIMVGGDYKLFFEDSKTEDYAELYVNIDPDSKWIELAEKDPEYRSSLIHFFKKK